MNVREAFTAATPQLREFRHALNDGSLVICAQCETYQFAADPRALGQCRRHRVEAWPFVPFECAQFNRRERKST